MATTTDSYTRLRLTNVQDDEVVYQRCLLITGSCHHFADSEDFIAVKVRDTFRRTSTQQNWPIANGSFRCLVMLHTGPNRINFKLFHKGQIHSSNDITIQYQPLLQVPPLHLAIMVAKDSPLLIDCPPTKRGAISSAHSSLDAAIVKLRMAAYMWQALTAEDFRLRGMGRRSFRLDEEWGVDTTTAASMRHDAGTKHMDTIARVNIIRSEKVVTELRSAYDGMHNFFEKALLAHGAPFTLGSLPVVAGMILDTQYSIDSGKTFAHSAMGRSKPSGLSLGIYGSHTTYSWPRFLEEVPSCLLDRSLIGDTVANDRGQCFTMRDACCVGQAGLFHQVRYAFGVTDETYQPWQTKSITSWSAAFVAQPSKEPWVSWDLGGALVMKTRHQFRLPGDKALTKIEQESEITVACALDENEDAMLEIMCMAGIARVRFISETVKEVNFLKRKADELDDGITPPPSKYIISQARLEEDLGRGSDSELDVLGMNGKRHKGRNIWRLLADRPFIKVPGTSLVLSKRSVGRQEHRQPVRDWALLLKKRSSTDPSGFTTASRIDLRVGAIMDGAVVYYRDGSHANCGLPDQDGYGGHQSEDKSLSPDEVFRISRVEVGTGGHNRDGEFNGCRMSMANNESWGQLNNHGDDVTERLVCSFEERIIGFYGKSFEGSGYPCEFGIITAPRDIVDSAEGLPTQIYDMSELMNNPRGNQHQDDDGDEEEDDNDSSRSNSDEDMGDDDDDE
ncbi:hypothetical protein F5Y18DRAFT_371730 [Xylariaceae sp. FL1019]|nr:hypothetical protein F5Y18DRAFT_371730 [Xylariaceae sp. FL1019]